jgi:hypothetical protein
MPYSVSLTTRNILNPDPQLGNFGQPIEEKKDGGIDPSFTKVHKTALRIPTRMCTLMRTQEITMTTIKVGVREFRERIASFLESDSPVAVTRRGETLGVYVPTRRKHPKTADLGELKAAATRLAEVLADMDEEEVVAEFKQLRRQSKNPSR